MKNRIRKKTAKIKEEKSVCFFKSKAKRTFEPELRMIYNSLSLTRKERLDMLDDVIMNTRKRLGLWMA